MIKQIVFFFLFLTVLPAKAFLFEEAYKIALENSSEIKILRMECESASWEKEKAFSGYLPKLFLESRHLRKERFEELEVSFGGETMAMPAVQPYNSLGLNANINIFNGFRTNYEFQAASLEKEAADFRLKRKEEQKRAEVRTLFYKALGSQILVNVADQNIQALESQFNDIGVRIRSGMSTRYDSLRIEVQLEDARTEKVAAESRVVIARAKLFESIGILDNGSPLEGELPDDFRRIDLGKLETEMKARVDRAILTANRDKAQSLSMASRAHWYPVVSLFGKYEWYNNINRSITESDERFKAAYFLGISLSWNLFDGGASYAAQRQAALSRKIAEENLTKFDLSLPIVIEEAKRRFTYNAINYNVKLSSIRKAEEAVRLAKGGLKAGTRTNTDILDTVADLNRARASAIKSQVDAIEAKGELEVLMGHSL